ncbi:unnamed protein product [Litomosoides sigmodontis]|uniref:UPAR/Ly6 domain-containing protein n=1 Tax=Litomosoides sigmodontis TaxID=42156 RepID=A0A3P6T1C4_LITSI|nr:unnamed protein product [Litomosoides sigmodontis]
MHRRTLIILFSFLLVTVVSGLDCFTGRSGYGLLYTQCNPDVYHCAKITTIDPVHGLVADKGCDTENFCSTNFRLFTRVVRTIVTTKWKYAVVRQIFAMDRRPTSAVGC